MRVTQGQRSGQACQVLQGAGCASSLLLSSSPPHQAASEAGRAGWIHWGQGSLLMPAKMKSSGSAASQLSACRWQVTVLNWVLCKVSDATNCIFMGEEWSAAGGHEHSLSILSHRHLLGRRKYQRPLSQGKDTALPTVCCSRIVCGSFSQQLSSLQGTVFLEDIYWQGQLSSWPSLTQQLPSGPILVCLSLCILKSS